MVYLDYNATTPVDERVIKSIKDALTNAWTNPSSNSSAGHLAKAIIRNARNNIMEMIGANNPDEIIFTSGGTEANNQVIHTAIENFKAESFPGIGKMIQVPHIITSNIEHDSIILPLKHFQKLNKIELSVVPVSKITGQIEVEDIVSEIRNNTRLVTVMLANNETGIIQPVELIGERLLMLNKSRCRQLLPKILFHTDAAQAIGKIPVNVEKLYVDYLTVVGHKFYGPRIGALYVRYLHDYGNHVPLIPMFFGGGQERNYRPGTENTAMIAGLGKAAELVIDSLDEYQSSMSSIRDYLEYSLKDTFGDNVAFNSVRKGVERLPNTSSVALKINSLTGREILSRAKKLEASVGAACHGSKIEPSHILIASGVDKDSANCTIRLSVGRETTHSDIDLAISSLKEVLMNRKV